MKLCIFILLIQIAWGQEVDWNHWDLTSEETWEILKTQKLEGRSAYVILQLWTSSNIKSFNLLLEENLQSKNKFAGYENWDDVGLIMHDEYDHISSIIDKVDLALHRLLMRNPLAKKLILFNLSRFSPEWSWGEKILGGKTNFITRMELELIFSEPKYQEATVFFRDGKIMSKKEVQEFFEPYIDKMFKNISRRSRSKCLMSRMLRSL